MRINVTKEDRANALSATCMMGGCPVNPSDVALARTFGERPYRRYGQLVLTPYLTYIIPGYVNEDDEAWLDQELNTGLHDREDLMKYPVPESYDFELEPFMLALRSYSLKDMEATWNRHMTEGEGLVKRIREGWE